MFFECICFCLFLYFCIFVLAIFVASIQLQTVAAERWNEVLENVRKHFFVVFVYVSVSVSIRFDPCHKLNC